MGLYKIESTMDYIILHFKDIGDTKCNLIDTE